MECMNDARQIEIRTIFSERLFELEVAYEINLKTFPNW